MSLGKVAAAMPLPPNIFMCFLDKKMESSFCLACVTHTVDSVVKSVVFKFNMKAAATLLCINQ